MDKFCLVVLLSILGVSGCTTFLKRPDAPKIDVKIHYLNKHGSIVRVQDKEAYKCDHPSFAGSRVIKPADWKEILFKMQYMQLQYAGKNE